MPTGYTADVADGKVTDVREFAARCARGFMPFIHMRDDSWDVPLRMPTAPDNSYEVRSLEDAKRELREWQTSTEEEKYARWSTYVHETEKRNNEAIIEKNETEARYRKMLAQVQEIDAPGNVQSFKDFLVSQLEESIKFDCNTSYYNSKPLSYSEWYDMENEAVLRTVIYREKSVKEAQERYDKQCELIRAYADTFGFEVEDA